MEIKKEEEENRKTEQPEDGTVPFTCASQPSGYAFPSGAVSVLSSGWHCGRLPITKPKWSPGAWHGPLTSFLAPVFCLKIKPLGADEVIFKAWGGSLVLC
jgi:hypothetical protein